MADLHLKNSEIFIRAAKISVSGLNELSDDIKKYTYINSCPLKDFPDNGITFSEQTIIRIWVSDNCPDNNFTFDVSIDNTAYTLIQEVTVKTDEDFNLNTEYQRAENLNTPDNSYMLLRVNPKVSGNIKVVVDKDENLYFDSIKVNAELNRRKYRKVPVSYRDYYGRNLAAYARNLPSNSYIYEVPENYHKLFSVVNNFKDQYVDIYRYGAKTNTDKLYDENFAILAPLKIGKTIPDFFLVFKYPGVADLTESMQDIDIMKKLISSSTLIKSFDMRLNSKLGTYVRTIRDKSKDTVAPLYVSYNPGQFNTYTGITLNKGTVTTIYESPLIINYKNQVQADNFYTLGFERNGLLSDSVVNFEFMFNDEKSDTFEINTYFGLYVKVNGQQEEIYNIDNILTKETGELVKEKLLNASLNASEKAEGILYCITDKSDCHIIPESLSSYDLSQYNNKPGDPFLSTYITNTKIDSTELITLKVTNFIEPGEHFRIIYKDSSTVYDIYEVILSNYEKYKDEKFSHPIENIGEEDGVTYNIKRISLYTEYRDNNTIYTDINQQINDIATAFNLLNAPYVIYARNNTLIIESYNEPNSSFERITNLCNPENDFDLLNYDENRTVQFFGSDYTVEPQIVKIDENIIDTCYKPINFELLGNRICYITNFKDFNLEYDCYPIVITLSDEEKKLFDDQKFIIYYDNNGYNFLTHYENYNAFNGFNDNEYIVFTTKQPNFNSNIINLYKPYIINFGLVSYFNVKDYNFNVIDNLSDIGMPGERITNISDKFNEIDLNVLEGNNKYIVEKPIETFSEYVSNTDSVPLYGHNEISGYESTNGNTDWDKPIYEHPTKLILNKYLKFKYDRNIKKSYISLVSPYNCKWEAVGTDILGNNIKLTYNNSLLKYSTKAEDPTNHMYIWSFFIPSSTEDSYPNDVFSKLIGYFSTADIANISSDEYRKYFDNMLSEKINDSTLHDEIFKGSYNADDLLYSENTQKFNKYSLAYSRGLNTIEFISGGVKFNIKSTSKSILDFEKYNGFKASFICCTGNSMSNSDTEIFIDEQANTILFIWYKGIETLSTSPSNFEKSEYVKNNSSIYYKRIGLRYKPEHIYNYTEDGNNYIIVNSKTKPNINRSLFLSTENQENNLTLYLTNSNGFGWADSDNYQTNFFYAGNALYGINADLNNTDKSKFNEKLYKAGSFGNKNYAYLISVNSSTAESLSGDLNDLNDLTKYTCIYIKRKDGKLRYYDNLTSDLYLVSVVDPIDETYIKTNKSAERFYVHPTYFNPDMIEMFGFEYVDDDLTERFELNTKLANIKLSEVSKIDQMWYNKYSLDTKYCMNINETAFALGIDLKKDQSILESSWNNNFFNKYARDEAEDKKDKANLEYRGIKSFLNGNSSNNKEYSIYDYLPTIPKYLMAESNIRVESVKTNIKYAQEVFDASSYDTSVFNVYNEQSKNLTSYSVESPNFKI